MHPAARTPWTLGSDHDIAELPAPDSQPGYLRRVVTRPRSGMRVPVEAWFHGALHRQAKARLLDGFADGGLVRRRYLEGLLESRTSSYRPRCGVKLWLLVTLEAWLRGALGAVLRLGATPFVCESTPLATRAAVATVMPADTPTIERKGINVAEARWMLDVGGRSSTLLLRHSQVTKRRKYEMDGTVLTRTRARARAEPGGLLVEADRIDLRDGRRAVVRIAPVWATAGTRYQYDLRLSAGTSPRGCLPEPAGVSEVGRQQGWVAALGIAALAAGTVAGRVLPFVVTVLLLLTSLIAAAGVALGRRAGQAATSAVGEVLKWANAVPWVVPAVGLFTSCFVLAFNPQRPPPFNRDLTALAVACLILSLINGTLGAYTAVLRSL